MKNQVLCSLKKKKKNSRLSSAAVIIGTFRMNIAPFYNIFFCIHVDSTIESIMKSVVTVLLNTTPVAHMKSNALVLSKKYEALLHCKCSSHFLGKQNGSA